MDFRNMMIGGVAGGVLLLTLQFLFSTIGQWIDPYDIFLLGGIRAIEDPILLLFFAHPMVFSFSAVILFGTMEKCLPRDLPARGIRFGLLLFVMYTVPSTFVIVTSMDYPLGFHIGNVLLGIIGFPILGILFAAIGRSNSPRQSSP